MEIIKYLNACITDCAKDTLEELKDHLGINWTWDERFPELFVLNYDQIESPKFHPITLECRSLVVEYREMGSWEVVSRSFDRFFNYGETETAYDAEYLMANEKRDGSLIGLFYHGKYGWLYRTRKMLMPESSVNGTDVTWDELIEEALGEDWLRHAETFKHDQEHVNGSFTCILEVTSPDNHVVTRYADRKMTLLAARSVSGEYLKRETLDLTADHWGWLRPELIQFDSMADCVTAARELRDLQEGFVMYNRHGAPVCKVKNPAYVCAHHLRGEGPLTPRRIMDLVMLGETDEYLSIFPEDTPQIAPYINAYGEVFQAANREWEDVKEIPQGKEFALAVKDSKVKHLLFRRKQGATFKDAFSGFFKNAQYELISNHL